jgi:para-aminobenzoate synthetase component 1
VSVTITPARYVEDPLPTFEQLLADPFPVLLESAHKSEPFARYSIVTASPYQLLCYQNKELKLYAANECRALKGDPFDALQALVSRHRLQAPSELPFLGGGIGFLSYDLKDGVERLPSKAARDFECPDLLVGFYDHAICFDHVAKKAFRIEMSNRRSTALEPSRYEKEFGAPVVKSDPSVICRDASNFTREEYLKAIEHAKEYILAGDIYEVSLSQRFVVDDPIPHPEMYRRLRATNPAWYSAFMTFGRSSFLSMSPEEFLFVRGRSIRTRPIKGTRRRGRSQHEDDFLKDELWTSEKDDAELAMIVDLERNDLGRVCEYGTVTVREPKLIETHASVLHLSATVEGQLRADAGLADVLRATFPGGSVTGAPKIRAMEIIEELEPTKRGPYTGAFGYFGYNGTTQLAMSIRTTLAIGHEYYYQAGGAIVADSVPEQEYEETLVKAAPFRKIFQLV